MLETDKRTLLMSAHTIQKKDLALTGEYSADQTERTDDIGFKVEEMSDTLPSEVPITDRSGIGNIESMVASL
jgi:hypothetical protein